MLGLNYQQMFDAICNEVGKEISPLFVNWSIGRRKDVVAELDARLDTGLRGAEEGLQTLIEEGWLTVKPLIAEGCLDPDEPRLGITHHGWSKWTYFDEGYVMDWNFGTIEEWLKWDGRSDPNAGVHQEVFQPRPANKKSQPVTRRTILDAWKPSKE